jgi:protein phosphatase
MSVALDCFGITDKGKVRQINQDNFLIVDVKKSVNVLHSSLSSAVLKNRFGKVDANLLVVADGVGGGPDGDRASEATVSALLGYVTEAIDCFNEVTDTKEHELLEALESTVRDVHEKLRTEHEEKRGHAPATTLTMVLLIWPRAYLVHVGDSRAYVRRGGRVQQLTRDQTFGEYMVNVGAWTEEQAAQSKPAAALASAVGGSEMTPVVGLIDLEPGDGIMLCTDGLTKHVSNERIATVFGQSASSEEIGKQLLSEALEGGGSDNVAVVVMRSIAG